jgi:hypothetical protein
LGLVFASPLLAACAGLVGADFGDSHYLAGAPGGGDADSTPTTDGSATPLDAAPDATPSPPPPGGEGGPCSGASCGGGPEASTPEASIPEASSPDVVSPPPDGGAPDATPPPADPGIPCGTTFCKADGVTMCCGDVGGGGSSDSCSTVTGQGCIYNFYCDDSSECAGGQVCCMDDDVGQSKCATKCTATQQQFCNPASSGACPSGQSCVGAFTRSDLHTTYHFCE